MPERTTPYGSWKSPITSELLAADAVRFEALAVDGKDVYWTEMRPGEGGRYVLVRRAADGRTGDVTPDGFSVRSTVHEYGGGAALVTAGVVCFSNSEDQRLYRHRPEEPPRPITPARPLRYADGALDRWHQRLFYVREDHRRRDDEAINTIVTVDLDGGGDDGGTVIASGSDFYAAPRPGPDGSRLAWLQWSHPNMPWDGVELVVSYVATDGSVGPPTCVAGGPRESVLQPRWSPDGELYFISDRSGWWNLYRRRDGQSEPICPMAAEFAPPPWNFAQSSYAFESARSLLCVYSRDGRSHLCRIDLQSLEFQEIKTPFTSLSSLQVGPGFAAFIAGSPTAPTVVASMDLERDEIDVLACASRLDIDRAFFSQPEPITFPTEDDLEAHAYYYAPANPDHEGPEDQRPPLLVKCHGGPTGAASSNLNLTIQYWTSRGYAVVDVNYGGSTGFGRPYRERLRGKFGIVDVDDCVNAALHLAALGRVDGERLAIDGGSAGGYTTLAALTFRDVFKVGASYYGISDLGALARDTHKFESRYSDSLVGPWPEARAVYEQRSPINFVDRLSVPVIFFQGAEDVVVPPAQAELMVEALRKKGIAVAYLLFEGEQHGFRKAENVRRAIDAQFAFFAEVLGFTSADGPGSRTIDPGVT